MVQKSINLTKLFIKSILVFLFSVYFSSASIYAQTDSISGKVTDVNSTPLIGVNVYWIGTTTGTTTNENGLFSIAKSDITTKLVISLVGYANDTLNVTDKTTLNIQLTEGEELKEVEVSSRIKSSSISYINPLKLESISEKELEKAACCNLSESFETSPSVDVAFTDAITGTRQIQLLGLAGPYTQVTRENMPDVRGLSSLYGLVYTPGTWIESIQLNKGAGSVVNGFESIAGQINVELRKPESTDRWYFNGYGNQGGRTEANINFAHKFKNKKWSTALLLHAKANLIKHDKNDDQFLDMPISQHFIALNRWKYKGNNGIRFQSGIKATYIDSYAGQVDFDPNEHKGTTIHWGMTSVTKRYEAWLKLGKIFKHKHGRSIGFQASGSLHDFDSYFGLTNYVGKQESVYSNLIFQDLIGNSSHKYRTGLSLQYDRYDEKLGLTDFNRTEYTPGAYFEYTYQQADVFSLVAGIRGDYNNFYGSFVTPRLHIRYVPIENIVIRASAGRGQRTVNVIAENNGLLASSRIWILPEIRNDKVFGLDPEVAWNYGINVTKNFTLDYREGALSVDFYRTDFENQVVIDLDNNAQEISFYNLKGQSFSNSFQIQLDYELIKRLDVRLAYRFFDVQTTYHDQLLQKPLVSKHRAFINLGYHTRSNWKIDYTLNWQGEKRLPNTLNNPVAYRPEKESPQFITMNAQISKTIKEFFEIYIGMENILDYKQDNPILASDRPFGNYFDATMIWGPIFGRNTYIGFRYRIK